LSQEAPESEQGRDLLDSPELLGIEPGSPEWFEIQRKFILSRPLVRSTYDQWYRAMLADVASVPLERPGDILEIGSGSGYVKTINPTVITSDIVEGHSDRVVDAQALPFSNESLRGILLTHVFHHIPDVRRFLSEAERTLVPGGVISMIDVCHTPLARLLFGRFHPEGYDSSAREWALDSSQAMAGANQALTWIVLRRDRELFVKEWPMFALECCELLPWLGYAMSGGVTRRDLVPRGAVKLISVLDKIATIANPLCALHWHIRIRKLAQ